MGKLFISNLLLVMVLILVGCSQTEAELPTLIPTLGGDATPIDNGVEPPTVEVQIVDPTQIPAPPSPLVRSTLPPEWTVAPANVTIEPTTTAVPPTPIPQATFLPGCATFGPDDETNERIYTPGETPTIAWIAVPEAINYRVALFDEFQIEVFSDFTAETVYQFPAEFFEESTPYSWSVFPLNAQIQQFCPPTGAELFPDRPPVNG